MLRFTNLASGSAGNATLVEAHDGTHHTRLLIDCGLGWRQLQQRLAALSLSPDALDALFITHEHGDHLGCALTLHARCRTPLYTSAGTLHAIQAQRATRADAPPLHPAHLHIARDSQPLPIKGLQLHPFTVPHDAREPLQLRCTDGKRSLGILTDLGHTTAHVLRQLQGSHALLLESNHDPQLLAASRYPPFLQRRIAGPHGHLSNAQAAQTLAALHHSQLHTIVAAHLSESNNHPPLARQTLADAIGCNPQDILLALRDGLAEGWISV